MPSFSESFLFGDVDDREPGISQRIAARDSIERGTAAMRFQYVFKTHSDGSLSVGAKDTTPRHGLRRHPRIDADRKWYALENGVHMSDHALDQLTDPYGGKTDAQLEVETEPYT
jgi:hypothetical protein